MEYDDIAQFLLQLLIYSYIPFLHLHHYLKQNLSRSVEGGPPHDIRSGCQVVWMGGGGAARDGAGRRAASATASKTSRLIGAGQRVLAGRSEAPSNCWHHQGLACGISSVGDGWNSPVGDPHRRPLFKSIFDNSRKTNGLALLQF